jgi:hypothetical protein
MRKTMKPPVIALLLCAVALFAMSAGPALAWWQFVSRTPEGERKVHTPYANEKVCKATLKQVEAELKRKYPKLYPSVGSCEEYR